MIIKKHSFLIVHNVSLFAFSFALLLSTAVTHLGQQQKEQQ